ncbi:MAG: hypothetical protein LBI94_05360 [Treponema sp.]|jgi:hypothetical protein|nr:hypothetical protein [Treponema sp.]
MNLPQKTIFSLLISVLLFTAFSLLAFTGLFDLLELRFYHPQLVKSLDQEVDQLSRAIDTLLSGLQGRFAETLEDDAVKRSFLPNQQAEDTLGRAQCYDFLMNSLPGLQVVRFVDAGGSRIYFSTLAEDLLSRTDPSLSYRSYQDCPGVLPYGDLESTEGQKGRIIFDGVEEQLIFSYPFSDSLEVYRGSALFTLSVRAVTEYLIRQGQLGAAENLVAVDSPDGFLLGLPALGTGGFKPEAAWHGSILTLYNTGPAGVEPLALISARAGAGWGTGDGFFVGRLVQEDMLILPPVMRFVLLSAFFLTTFLLVFLLFSLKQDSITIIQARLRRLQSSLIRQYYDSRGGIDWKRWSRELERRREDVRLEVKRGLLRTGKDKKEIDALIDRSWDELIAAMSGLPAAGPSAGFDEERMRSLVEKVLRGAGPGSDLAAEDPKPADFDPAESEVLEELEVVETPEEPEGLPGAKKVEKADIKEMAGNTDEAAESPEEVSAEGPASPEDLDALASRIEFGPTAETPAREREDLLELDLSSPFNTLSFESPDFSGFEGEKIPAGEKEESGETRKKRRAAGNDGLEDISEDGGLPLIYQPFLFRENAKPCVLRPLTEPGGEPIHEQDGIHLINSDILDPTLETSQTLDPKFLRLVESILKKERVPPK